MGLMHASPTCDEGVVSAKQLATIWPEVTCLSCLKRFIKSPLAKKQLDTLVSRTDDTEADLWG